MSRASEHHEHMTATFDRENAKASVVRILSKLIPSQLSISDCARITGANRSNISRALKGESLLNANDLSKIIKYGYKLKSTHEVGLLLSDKDLDLFTYFNNELGEEFMSADYTDHKITTSLNSAINNENAQMLYSILYARESISSNDLIKLFGIRDAKKLVSTFEHNGVATFHKELDVLVINKDVFTTDLEFRKKQISIICNSLDALEINEKNQRYLYDNVIVSEKYAKELRDLIYRFTNDMSDIVSRAENESIDDRHILFNYALVSTNQKLNIGKEVKQ